MWCLYWWMFLLAGLLSAGAMGLWHGVEYFEKEKVVGPEFYQQWSNVSHPRCLSQDCGQIVPGPVPYWACCLYVSYHTVVKISHLIVYYSFTCLFIEEIQTSLLCHIVIYCLSVLLRSCRNIIWKTLHLVEPELHLLFVSISKRSAAYQSHSHVSSILTGVLCKPVTSDNCKIPTVLLAWRFK